MKDFFRLLTVAVLSFALVGAALIYSRDDDFVGGMLDAISAYGPNALRSGGEDTAQEDPAAQGHTRIWVERPRRDVWMGVAGFPDQFDLRFPIPGGISYTGGALELTFDSQLAAGSDGRLTISVNGLRRGEIVLDTGQHTHSVEIALSPEDLLGASLDVGLAGRGVTNSGQICPTNAENSGSAITLLPSSGLALYTDDPADTAAIRLASLSEPMTLALGDTPDDQAAAIWAGQMLSRAGVGTTFSTGETADLILAPEGGNALGIDAAGRIALAGRAGIHELLAGRAAITAVRTLPADWPVTVDALGAETTVKSFRGSRRWVINYRLADLASGRMPTQLDLALKTSVLEAGSHWVVRVSLNGNLLSTQRFDGTADLIEMPVDLPVAVQGLRNAITVELIDTTPNDSICRAGADAQAQLLPATTLLADGEQPEDGWGAMVSALAGADSIGLIVDGRLTASEAGQARAMLAAFLPASADIVYGEAAAKARTQITIVGIDRLRSALSLAEQLMPGTSRSMGALVMAGQGRDAELSLTALGDRQIRDFIEEYPTTKAAIIISTGRP